MLVWVPAYAGGDLGGGGFRLPKKLIVLTKAQKAKLQQAQSNEEQKAIWLNQLTEDQEEQIYDYVFSNGIKPQVNPVAEE